MTDPGGLSTRTNEYPSAIEEDRGGGRDYFRLINVARDSARGGIGKFVTPAVAAASRASENPWFVRGGSKRDVERRRTVNQETM